MSVKHPAAGRRGVVVTNHPLATGSGAELLLAGGNAVDAAVAALFALTVVEPMMVGVLGGGVAHLRSPEGRHVILDGLSTAPAAAAPDMYRTVGDSEEVEGRENTLGPRAVAVPGALRAWCRTLERHGTLPLGEVIAPAIRLAEQGWRATPYLAEAVAGSAAELAADPGLAATFLPGGAPLRAGERVVRGDYAGTLRLIAREGEAALHGGALGRLLAEHLAARGGLVTLDDLRVLEPVERAPIRARYRGREVLGPPPPASAGVHVAQMLKVLEGFDLAALGPGSPAALHLIAEVLKLAFADRAVATADPAFVEVPVARLTSDAYAAERRAELDPGRARDWGPGALFPESPNTTHVTAADDRGWVVSTTQTINSLFGARITVPGTGMIANDYMKNFDPRPGRALSIAPGKRVFTSMAPLMVLEEGRPLVALGLPGGLRIFGCAMQAVINLLDHGMGLQEALEAPRVWTMGGPLLLEPGIPEAAEAALRSMGHATELAPTIGGGVNAIAFSPDGTMTGAACWRADGAVLALGGGLARPGVRFGIGRA